VPSILYGKVTNTNDPEKIGRIQVELDQYAEPYIIPYWLRLIQPMANKSSGILFLPEVGDEVVLLRDDDGPEPYIVLGSVYNNDNKPSADAVPAKGKEKDAEQNFVKQFKTKSGHELTFMEESGKESITLKTGDGKLSILMDQKGGAITITSDKELTIDAPQGKVTVNAKEVAVTGSSTVEITGNKSVSVKGNTEVALTGGGANIKLSGGMVELG